MMAAGRHLGRRERVWRNARLATMASDAAASAMVETGAIAARDGRIVYAGPRSRAAGRLARRDGRSTATGRWITPGLIDCHTHLVYAGDRAHEFELRLAGATYEEIARAGGGIVSTVRATARRERRRTRRAALPRLDALLAEGVTTVEIKSGYGLDLDDRAQDRCAPRARLGQAAPGRRSRTTFLGAHALPPEFDGDKRRLYRPGLPTRCCPPLAAEGLADAVDGFCEGIAFTPERDRARVRRARKAPGLPVKLHADQLSNLGGAALAARFGALSADHLEYTDEAGVAAMATAGHGRGAAARRLLFPARDASSRRSTLFRQHGVPMARRHRLQSRHLAADLAAADDEHGGDAVPA